jgi:hypothetical protein
VFQRSSLTRGALDVSQASGSNPFGIGLAEARTRKQFTAASWASAGQCEGRTLALAGGVRLEPAEAQLQSVPVRI